MPYNSLRGIQGSQRRKKLDFDAEVIVLFAVNCIVVLRNWHGRFSEGQQVEIGRDKGLKLFLDPSGGGK